MATVPAGIYENLLTTGLSHQLSATETDLVQLADLDPAEAHETLARHIAGFVTLVKTEAHFSPTTMYADHAISPTSFQWESQNSTAESSPTGQRYIHHRDMGTTVHLFVRESKTADGTLGTPPYLYAGPMDYVSHTGERPMRILWNLRHALPADVFRAAKVA